jgi:TolB-like protein/DNA-binding SARP family transcriptional activator
MGLSLKVLGEFAVRDGSGRDLSLPTRKTRALLAYLAVYADRPQLRDRLMALLWSDREDRQARQSLNQALRSIRRLGDEAGITLLDGDGEHVTLRGDAVDIDVARFRASLADDPTAAAALYGGPFLDGLSSADPAFDEWHGAMQIELHDQACAAFERAAAAAADQGRIEAGLAAARRLVALDSLREEGHRLLMRLLHEGGDRAAALRQYQICADVLERELQVEPEAATSALFEQIRKAEPAAAPAAAGASRPPVERRRWRKPVFATAAAGLVAVAATGVWLTMRSGEEPRPQATAQHGLTLPDRPSIAVLPFNNMSGDPEQEYFSDGMTEDLITDLSKVSGLFVIARNSSFAYKGRRVDLRKVGQELGVRYVLEGSVRKAGGRVRINAQLIDSGSGGHVWAERFDRKLEDIFDLQDQVTRKIVSALAVTLKPAEVERRSHKTKIDPNAYDVFLRGLERLRRFTPETNIEAREFFRQAMLIDPRYARAVSGLGFAYAMDVFLGAKVDREAALQLAERYVSAGLKLDDTVPQVHFAVSFVHQRYQRYDLAVQAARRAIELDTNYADGYAQLASALIQEGFHKEGLKGVASAIRLNPQRPFFYLEVMARGNFMLGRYDEAAKYYGQVIQANPGFIIAHRGLAASYAHLGRMEDAKWEAAEILTLQPDFSLRAQREMSPFRRKEDMERFIDGLRKAGLPE